MPVHGASILYAAHNFSQFLIFIIMPRNKNLVMVAAGASSLHIPWLAHQPRNFDVLTIDFSDDARLEGLGEDYYFRGNGTKWQLVVKAAEFLGDVILHYDYIWLPDDDIFVRARDVERLFQLVAAYHLDLAQPALSRDSFFSHRITLQVPFLNYRLTSFVEIMAPVMTRQLFVRYLELMEQCSSGWGMDFLWQCDCEKNNHRVGIIDKVKVVHTRPINAPSKSVVQGRGFYARMGVKPWEEMEKSLTSCDPKSVRMCVKKSYFSRFLRAPYFLLKFLNKRLRRCG